MNNATTYLGTALKMPLALSNGAGVVIGGSEVVEQSIIRVLTTPKYSDEFNYLYGSRLDEVKFEQNDDILESFLYTFIYEAILDWEGRAKFIDCNFRTQEDRVDCIITYKLLSSN